MSLIKSLKTLLFLILWIVIQISGIKIVDNLIASRQTIKNHLTFYRSKIAAHFNAKFIDQSFVGQIQTRMMLLVIANFCSIFLLKFWIKYTNFEILLIHLTYLAWRRHYNCNISASYSSNIPTHNLLSCKFEKNSVDVHHQSNTLSWRKISQIKKNRWLNNKF
jgi:hypothetical protein